MLAVRRTYIGAVLGMSLALAACAPGEGGDRDQNAGSVAEVEPGTQAGESPDYDIPGSKERFQIRRDLIADKLGRALLPAMRAHDIDMWIVLDRENNPDPIQDELGGRGTGVRAAFVFFDNGSDEPEKIYLGSHEQPANSVIATTYDQAIYYGYSKEGLTPHLRQAVHERDPKRIGINTSHTLPSADGLTLGLYNYLIETVGPEYAERMVSAELLVRDFRLNRTERETALYRGLLEWTSRWMQEALSTEHVTTGTTTAEDIAWWLRDRALELGLTGGGTVRVVREGELLPIHDPDITIQPGDIIGIDGGLKYLGYAIDIKRTAYVLRPGEQAVPEYLMDAWRAAHRMGDLYARNMIVGEVGHEIWATIIEQAQELGYAPAGPDAGGDSVASSRPEVGIYGHSVGNVAHGIGARIAPDVPFAYGDRVRFPLAQGEWVAIELHVSTPIPEWGGKTWYARFEEAGLITKDGVEWMLPPQTELFLIESAG